LNKCQEGAVDDLEEILDMRSDFEEKGLTFYIHVDAAWGGYFASVLRSKDGNQLNAVEILIKLVTLR
jgi:glutamate/tyrosine decarboxylase-like PLP-dependent enzyme